jgi:hypothetical protein
MSNLTREALRCCDEFGLNVKLHCEESKSQIYCSPLETHYIMRGDKIIVSLNQPSVVGWILRKSEEARRVKSLLVSDGLKLSDYEKCKDSLMETVSPKGNLKIYEEFLE